MDDLVSPSESGHTLIIRHRIAAAIPAVFFLFIYDRPLLIILANSQFIHIKVTLQSFSNEDIIQNLLTGTIDLAFVYSIYTYNISKFNRIAMIREKPRLYYSSDFPLIHADTPEIEDFQDAAFVVLSYSSLQGLSQLKNLPYEPRNIITVNSISEIELYVQSGMAVAVLGPSQSMSNLSNTRYIELTSTSQKIGTDAIWSFDNHNPLLKSVLTCLLS